MSGTQWVTYSRAAVVSHVLERVIADVKLPAPVHVRVRREVPRLDLPRAELDGRNVLHFGDGLALHLHTVVIQ